MAQRQDKQKTSSDLEIPDYAIQRIARYLRYKRKTRTHSRLGLGSDFSSVVEDKGLEPLRLKASEPKSDLSTNSNNPPDLIAAQQLKYSLAPKYAIVNYISTVNHARLVGVTVV